MPRIWCLALYFRVSSDCAPAMELAGHIVWRRCASHWRARTCCSLVLQQPLTAAFPSLCISTVSSFFSTLHSTPPMAVCNAVSQGAPLSLCNSAVSQPSASLCSLLYTRAFTSNPLRNLCSSTGNTSCWSCQAVVSSSQLFCSSCNSIQPPDESKDFFQLLGCECSFNVDVQDLQRKYRNLQRLLHPDYFSQKSQHERDISEKQSALVNKAYNTLLSPLSRGIYLLSLHGVTISEGTEGGVDDPFLFEILEINEKLNDMSTEAELEEIGTFVQDKCQSLTENVAKAFEKGDLDGAKMLLVKMKYYSNILDQVKKKLIP
ncbi:iron-sulfur cluster co-chaperone protein HscB [Leptodactylus fuscus]|uniref:iron-sulfur cluster co-chaperone protein HscB n=1 Tax=Leptodactylus fuscus TaxID=238119 RepID=UPI003F4E79D6